MFAHADGCIETTTLLFIEAKGIGAVDSEQLTRKLVRIDRILEASHVRSAGIAAKFVLALPAGHAANDPRHALEHASSCKDEELASLLRLPEHQGGIGSKDASHTFVLKGFPKTLDKVTRIRGKKEEAVPDDYTRWAIEPRRRPPKDVPTGISKKDASTDPDPEPHVRP